MDEVTRKMMKRKEKIQGAHTTIAIAIAIEWMVYSTTTKLGSSGTKQTMALTRTGGAI